MEGRQLGVNPKIGVGPPKSSILIGFSIINHPFWGTPIFGNTQLSTLQREMYFPYVSEVDAPNEGWVVNKPLSVGPEKCFLNQLLNV